ncbi:MAG: glutathione S-transferase N-terminal domain-containing protein [Pseudomonadota bacterium]
MTATAAPQSLALYHFLGCPYCEMVRAVIDEFAIDVEFRDIYGDPKHRDDLVAARGRQTVPVLAITDAAGEVQWMPESRDIVQWLRERHADGTLAK